VQAQCREGALSYLEVLPLCLADEVGLERIGGIACSEFTDEKSEVAAVDSKSLFQIWQQEKLIADQQGAIPARHPGRRATQVSDHGDDGTLLLHPGKGLEQVEHNDLVLFFSQHVKEQISVGGKGEHRLELNG